LNGLSFNVLRVLSDLPDKEFIQQIIQRKTGGPEWKELTQCLKDLVGFDCLEYTSPEKSTVGHGTYKITRLGRDISSDYWGNEQIAKIRRVLLGVKEPGVEEQV
jgi:hypothetical protein